MTFAVDDVQARSFSKPQHIIRCPYCVLGDEFRPMVRRPDWFVCEVCCTQCFPMIQRLSAHAPNRLKLHQAA
jgi:hypothetical protein